jgi:hypothetical protein
MSVPTTRLVQPPPASGHGRLRWLDDLDAAVSLDCLRLAAVLTTQGASPVTVIDLLEDFYEYLTRRLRAVVDEHICAELQATA